MRRLALILCLGVLTAACGGGSAPDPAAKKTLRFAIIPKALDIPVFNYARIGAERKAKELGNIEVIWRAPESADQLRQKEVLESFISQRVDGIAISCTNGDFLAPVIDKAIAAGIPVITWDADAPTSQRMAYYGVDDFKAGQRLATEVGPGVRLQGIRLVDEQDSTDGPLHHGTGLGSRLSDELRHQIRPGDLDQMSGGQHPQRRIQFRGQAGHRRLARSRRTGEQHVP